MKYYYRDFDTNKLHYTRGNFTGWERGGLLNAAYACFQRKASMLFIPEYCLETETRNQLIELQSIPPKYALGDCVMAQDGKMLVVREKGDLMKESKNE